MKEGPHRYIGIKLREIRDKLRLKADDVNRELGISRSYVSEFERGIKLPTIKYVKYLHDKYNVNINYIFCSDSEMFRPDEDRGERWDFGKMGDAVEEMLDYMSSNPQLLFAMLLKFTEYKMENKKFLEESFTMDSNKDDD